MAKKKAGPRMIRRLCRELDVGYIFSDKTLAEVREYFNNLKPFNENAEITFEVATDGYGDYNCIEIIESTPETDKELEKRKARELAAKQREAKIKQARLDRELEEYKRLHKKFANFRTRD